MRSLCGFLGENESCKEVLKKDWQTVLSLGTSHMELAAHLKTVCDE